MKSIAVDLGSVMKQGQVIDPGNKRYDRYDIAINGNKIAKIANWLPVSHARLVVAGDGPELAGLRERARELGIADRVHWLGHRDDVPGVLAGCGVFVLSSRNEGMANVMLEAMSVGTPVIATAISGVRTAVAADDGGSPAGWIVPPEDV